MNRQRKVLITTTYNELGIIIDTKAEEVAQPDLQSTCNQLATDCISRQMAIEAFEPTHYKDWYTPTIIETLETLPSVRPEVIAYGSGELVKESDGLVNDLVKDCISRQAVAKWLERWDGYVDKDIIERMKLRVIDIPSVQPQRKRGKWINHRNDDGHNIADCDQCGNAIQWFDGDEIPRYCCMCGARMEGESDG